jgi:hypothetical protein
MCDREIREKAQAQRDWNDRHGAGQSGGPTDPVPVNECMTGHAPMGPNEIQEMYLAEVLRRLDYHPPTTVTLPKFRAIRDAAKAFIVVLVRNCPPGSRDSEQAIAQVECAVMVANKAIANAQM